jgi:hypothetical protein
VKGDYPRERGNPNEDGEFAVYSPLDSSKAEVFSPSYTEHTCFYKGAVVGLLVDKVEAARKSLEAEGIEFIGRIDEWEPTGEVWPFFRAPDGNVYGIT